MKNIKRRWLCASSLSVMLAAGMACEAQAQTEGAPPAKSAKPDIVVTASRTNLLGKAATASQGSVTQKEVELRPIYRIGQLYETVPGLVVTIHSGEGKANQYLLRGFNLDHGTDFGSFVDSMPVNRPTNAHGQGYSDQNFLMAQLVAGLDFTKGPYYASVGDFGAVGSAHVRLIDDLPAQIQVSATTLKGQDLFAGGAYHFSDDDRLLAAVDVSHYDGPWTPPANFHKVDATLRYSHGDDANGYSLTAMYYVSSGHLETDQPLRAFQDGQLSRYAVLDPTDASRSERMSLSGHYGATGDNWKFVANAYAIRSTMVLWNDFTHFTDDEVNGDQEQQDEDRHVYGGDMALTYNAKLFGLETDTTIGLQDRYDQLYIDKRHTLRNQPLDYCNIEADDAPNDLPLPADAHASPDSIAYAAVNRNCNADRVRLNDLGLYIQNTTHWTPWLRTEVGVREEDYYGFDRSLTTTFKGSGSQTLLQPKGSLILGPWYKTEVYLSAGRGFHSDDVRGVFGTVPLEGFPGNAGRTPFLAPAVGEEIGMRTNIIPKVQLQFAVFQEDFKSELTYDADAGEDSASAPSRRQGVEISGQYRPFSWIEFNTDLAFSKARYTSQLATFGLDGPYIANAPSFIGSFGVLVDNLGPWFGGLQWRDLGAYPISDGDNQPQDKGYSEINLDVGYKVNPKLKVQVSVFNLLNNHGNSAAYYYSTRLAPNTEASNCDASAASNCFQIHPEEPISARFQITALF